jgi:hypothetical protein
MLTQQQIDTLKQYKQALDDYNTHKISYQQYIDTTAPLWDKLNKLFENNQKNN